jgi:hypothetical protein
VCLTSVSVCHFTLWQEHSCYIRDGYHIWQVVASRREHLNKLSVFKDVVSICTCCFLYRYPALKYMSSCVGAQCSSRKVLKWKLDSDSHTFIYICYYTSIFHYYRYVTEIAKLHMGLVVLVKIMSVLINFLLQNTNHLSVLIKFFPNFAGHIWQDWQFHKIWCNCNNELLPIKT